MSPKLLCIVLFVIVLLSGNWYVYEYVQNLEASERCSSDYPSVGLILDSAVMLDDGSLQTEDGTVYPSGAFWTEDGVVRGCPSSLGPYVRSCCPPGYILIQDVFYQCEEINNADEVYESRDKLEVFSGNDPLQKVNVSSDHYSVVVSDVCQSYIYFAYYDLILLDDGRILNSEKSKYERQEIYCFDVRDNLLFDTMPFRCDNPMQPFTKVNLYFILEYAFVVPLMMLHLVTFIVFLLMPELRCGCGKAIMNYVAAQFFKKFVLIFSNKHTRRMYVTQTIGDITFNHILKGKIETSSLGKAQYFFELSAHVWQLVIAFQIRHVFRPLPLNKTEDTPRFMVILYTSLCWGVCLFWTVLYYNFLRNNRTWKPFLDDGSIHNSLFLDGIKTLPLVVIEVASLVMCVSPLCRLRAGQKNSASLKGQRHNTPNIRWSNLFLKVTFITGVDYIFLNMFDMILNFNIWNESGKNNDYQYSEAIVPWFVRTTLYNINDLRGVEVFFIFVIKTKTYECIRRKLCSRQEQTPSDKKALRQKLQQKQGHARRLQTSQQNTKF